MDANEKDALQFCAVLACAGLCVVAGIVIELRNATTGGTLIDTLTTDASGDPAEVTIEYSGTAWSLLFAQYPSN